MMKFLHDLRCQQAQSRVKWIIPEKVQVVLNSKFTQDITLPPIFCSLLWQNNLAYKHTTENDHQVRGKDRELEHCLAMLRVQIALRIYVYRSWFSHSVSYKTDSTMRYSFKNEFLKFILKKNKRIERNTKIVILNSTGLRGKLYLLRELLASF